MRRLERTRRVLNRLSEPLRTEAPEPTDLDVSRAEDENPDALDCLDPDDPAHT